MRSNRGGLKRRLRGWANLLESSGDICGRFIGSEKDRSRVWGNSGWMGKRKTPEKKTEF